VSALKVKRPLSATVGVVLSIIGGVLYLSLLSLGIASEGVAAGEIFSIAYGFLWCILILVGGFFIFRRRYKFGGALALVFGICLFVDLLGALEYFFFLFPIVILPIIGGILGLVSKEKTALGVLGVAKLYGRLEIADLAAKLGKTEADVELAVIELQSKGEPIRFEAETREVIYIASETEDT